MIELREYIDESGRNLFRRWLGGLDSNASRRIRAALARLEAGNLSNVRGVGNGVLEYRIYFGPGYRVYFGRDGETLIILLAGGTKARQQRDIESARELWAAYQHENRERR